MSRFGHILWLSLLAALLTASSCGGVTETGNPCPMGDCETQGPTAEEGHTYINETYGVSVTYPATWNGGAVSSDVAEFFDARSPSTQVRMTFAFLSPEPASLQAYLAETYPDRDFVASQAGSNNGYIYDDPTAGDGGGDLQEYFFLGGDVLVHVTAEVFPEGEADLGDLLAGISFQG